MQTQSSFYRDANRVPIVTDGLITKRTITFAGGTTDAWGDYDGALNGTAIFTVEGLIFVKLIAICTADLIGNTATIEVGISGQTTIFMPQETAAEIVADTIWLHDAANADNAIIGEESAATGNLPEWAIFAQDIILTVGTANITSGALDFYCI